MEKYYSINDLSLMSGLTTRTLRNYLTMGLLKGNKGDDGAWRFTVEEVDAFFKEPFVKDSVRTKYTSLVYDFLANPSKKENRTCVILDIPLSLIDSNKISAFFCKEMEDVQDVNFNFHYDKGSCRVILSGKEDQVAKLLMKYYNRNN